MDVAGRHSTRQDPAAAARTVQPNTEEGLLGVMGYAMTTANAPSIHAKAGMHKAAIGVCLLLGVFVMACAVRMVFDPLSVWFWLKVSLPPCTLLVSTHP